MGVFLLLEPNAGRFTAMRTLILIVFALLSSPAIAQGWERYDNARFGYSMDVPPVFAGSGESDNGDGESFYNPSGAQGLVVWGAGLVGDFEGEVSSAMDYAIAENGWNITYQAVTPRWASFSGITNGRVLYQRMVLLCDGTSYAAFRAEYSSTNMTDMTPVIERLVQSLKGSDC